MKRKPVPTPRGRKPRTQYLVKVAGGQFWRLLELQDKPHKTKTGAVHWYKTVCIGNRDALERIALKLNLLK
jgi:hypothetical protein